jgi:hypothetical protein
VKDAQTTSLVERIRDYAMPEGAFACQGAWLRQKGEMRFSPEKAWMPFHAEQWFPGAGIDFQWKAWVRMSALVRARVTDSFKDGKGSLTAAAFGFVPVARSRGPATDKGEAIRGLAEFPWRPFAFGEASSLTWESTGTNELRARFADASTRAVVLFEADSAGQVQSAFAADRPRIVNGKVTETAWSGTFGSYRAWDGVRVPTVAEAAWLLPEGPFTYWRGRVTEFRVLRQAH